MVQPGEDSYAYDIFFTGKHINDHANIVPSICSSAGWTLYDGMRYGVTVEEIVAGSSAEKVLISMTSEEAPTSNGKYWQLIFNDIVSRRVRVFPTDPHQSADAYTWGVDASTIINDLHDTNNNGLQFEVAVERSGEGFTEESYGYTYTISFDEDDDRVGKEGAFSVLTEGDISTPMYLPVNKTLSRTKWGSQWTNNLNDLQVSGSYTGATDKLFVVKITSIYNTFDFFTCDPPFTDNNCDYESKLDSLTEEYNLLADNTSATQISWPTKYELGTGSGVYVNFNTTGGWHTVNDSWAFVAMAASDSSSYAATPKGTRTSATVIRSGLEKCESDHSGFRLRQVPHRVWCLYTKRLPSSQCKDQMANVLTLTTNLNTHTSISVKITYADVESCHTLATSSSVTEDYVLERDLEDPSTQNFCKWLDKDNCISVTRQADSSTANAGGYIYSIYFEASEMAYNVSVADISIAGYK